MKVIREFLKRKIPHLDSGPIDKSILYDLQEALSSGSGLFPGYDVRNDLPREVEAKGGGRIGLAGGMTRRAFLKLMGGAAATIGAAKSGIISAGKKGATKKVVKEVIKTPNAPGKPEWFDALVNKVILEGDDVTKKLATKDREIVHTKKINDQESVTVTQDLDDGAIRVEYDSPDNMGQEPVMMQFKPGMADETTGGKKPADRFDVVETEPQYVGAPEDADIEFIGESGGPGIDFIASDVTNLKTFATGKGPTMKEIVKSKKRKDLVRKVNDDNYEAAEYLGGKYGDGPEPDFPDDYSGYASGGIARLGYQMGGDVAYDATNTDIYGSSAITVTPDTVMDQFGNQIQSELGNNFNKPLIPQVTEQASKQEGIMNSSPVVSQLGGTGEIDMPIAGGNKNEMGILPVINQPYTAVMPNEGNKYVYDPDGTRRQVPLTPEEIDRIDMTKPPGTPSGNGALTVMPRYNDPLPQDQLLSGFEEYKKTNPPGFGTHAIVPVTLPGGYDYSFSGSAEANAFRKYLESIGQAPYQARPNQGMLAKLASGGLAYLLGE